VCLCSSMSSGCAETNQTEKRRKIRRRCQSQCRPTAGYLVTYVSELMRLPKTRITMESLVRTKDRSLG